MRGFEVDFGILAGHLVQVRVVERVEIYAVGGASVKAFGTDEQNVEYRTSTRWM